MSEQARINELVAIIKGGDDKILDSAIIELSKIGKDAVPALIPLLSYKDNMVRAKTALTLGYIGNDARESASEIVSLLDHNDQKIQLLGAVVLSQMNIEKEKALPILRLNLESVDNNMRMLSEIGIDNFNSDTEYVILDPGNDDEGKKTSIPNLICMVCDMLGICRPCRY